MLTVPIGYATLPAYGESDGVVLVRSRDPHLGLGSPMSLPVMPSVGCMCTSSAEGGKIVAKYV